MLGLVAILFEGGMTTPWRDLRTVVLPAALLSTVGVVATGAFAGLAAYLLFDLSVGAIRALGADLLELTLEDGHQLDGRLLRDVGLPPDAIVALIVRDGGAVLPRGTTRLEAGDRLFVVARPRLRAQLERLFAADT